MIFVFVLMLILLILVWWFVWWVFWLFCWFLVGVLFNFVCIRLDLDLDWCDWCFRFVGFDWFGLCL